MSRRAVAPGLQRRLPDESSKFDLVHLPVPVQLAAGAHEVGTVRGRQARRLT